MEGGAVAALTRRFRWSVERWSVGADARLRLPGQSRNRTRTRTRTRTRVSSSVERRGWRVPRLIAGAATVGRQGVSVGAGCIIEHSPACVERDVATFFEDGPQFLGSACTRDFMPERDMPSIAAACFCVRPSSSVSVSASRYGVGSAATNRRRGDRRCRGLPVPVNPPGNRAAGVLLRAARRLAHRARIPGCRRQRRRAPRGDVGKIRAAIRLRIRSSMRAYVYGLDLARLDAKGGNDTGRIPSGLAGDVRTVRDVLAPRVCRMVCVRNASSRRMTA